MIALSANAKCYYLHSMDVYSYIQLFWTKNFFKLDCMDALQWNQTIFVGMWTNRWLIGEFLPVCVGLFWLLVVWQRDRLCPLCWLYLKMVYVVRITSFSAFQRYVLCLLLCLFCFVFHKVKPINHPVGRIRHVGPRKKKYRTNIGIGKSQRCGIGIGIGSEKVVSGHP